MIKIVHHNIGVTEEEQESFKNNLSIWKAKGSEPVSCSLIFHC